MKITKAVITTAGKNQRGLPLQTIVDRHGETKTALQVLIDETIDAGVEDICLVIHPGDQANYVVAAGELANRLHFVEQPEPRGYGHALTCAKTFVGESAFLHLVGDHLSISKTDKGCARQLVEIAEAEACVVSAVQPTRETQLTNFGAVGGKRAQNQARLFVVEHVVEKPTPTEAEQSLLVPGLRAGYYLCFFGMHVLTPAVLRLLEESAGAQTIHLSTALNELAKRERYLAYEMQGARYDIGVRYGLLNAQLALALSGKDRANVLASLVELMSQTS